MCYIKFHYAKSTNVHMVYSDRTDMLGRFDRFLLLLLLKPLVNCLETTLATWWTLWMLYIFYLRLYWPILWQDMCLLMCVSIFSLFLPFSLFLSPSPSLSLSFYQTIFIYLSPPICLWNCPPVFLSISTCVCVTKSMKKLQTPRQLHSIISICISDFV